MSRAKSRTKNQGGRMHYLFPPGFLSGFLWGERPTALGTPRRFQGCRPADPLPPIPNTTPSAPGPRPGSPPHSIPPHSPSIPTPSCPPTQNMLSYNSEHHSKHNPHPSIQIEIHSAQSEMYTSAREMFWQVGLVKNQAVRRSMFYEIV